MIKKEYEEVIVNICENCGMRNLLWENIKANKCCYCSKTITNNGDNYEKR